MKKVLLLSLFSSGILTAQAQTFHSRYTSNLPGIRAYSFAGVTTAHSNDETALYYNPAGLGTFNLVSFGISSYYQLNSSSFEEMPNSVLDATVENRYGFIRPDHAGLAIPIKETGFTLGLGYYRHMDRSFYEEWTIERTNGQNEDYTIDVSGGVHDIAVGFGRGWGHEEDMLVSFGSSFHGLFGKVSSSIEEVNTTTETESKYRGSFFRHGFMLRSQVAGLGLMLETPWQMKSSSLVSGRLDSLHQIVQYAPMVSIGGYAGGESFRFHVQYERRFQKDRHIYERQSNNLNFFPSATFTDENPINTIGLVLESGEPGLMSLRYSFRYANYPNKLNDENITSLMGVVSYGGLLIENLSLDVVVGFEYFPKHLSLNYPNGEVLTQKATYWRIGVSFGMLGFDKY